MQRLGRLGRHAGYERDSQFHSFQEFAAFALVPPFLYERITTSQEGQPPRLHANDRIDRQKLTDHINAVYPPPTDFQHYARIWGRLQPAKVYFTLLGKSMTAKYTDHNLREGFAPVRENLRQRYFKLVQATMQDTIDQWQSYRTSGEELLVNEAQSFRGGSPFDCGVLKEGEGEPLTYDLFWLLANARLDLLDQDTFCAAVEWMGRAAKPYQHGFQIAFFRWLGLHQQRQDVTVLLNRQVSDWGTHQHHTAQVLPGVTLDVSGHEWLNALNQQLARHAVVGVIVPGYEPQQLRREIYLPGLFALHRYRDAYGLMGCIAFGRHALLLDSKLRHHTLRANTGGALFC
jgi:CRISPR-associated endonuclease/helicase Cas3